MDYVPERVFEAILTLVLEEHFPEIENLTKHQKKLKKVLPELSRTMAYTKCNRINGLACKELHLNPVVLE